MGFVTFLLHCNENNLVFKILKHGKIWEGNLHYRPPLQILRDST